MPVSNKFEEDVLLYLRNIIAKLRVLSERVDKMESRALSLGGACSAAFLQVKDVVNKLYEEQTATREDLSEYGGVIQQSTFMEM